MRLGTVKHFMLRNYWSECVIIGILNVVIFFRTTL
jgi:hypothetical protein